MAARGGRRRLGRRVATTVAVVGLLPVLVLGTLGYWGLEQLAGAAGERLQRSEETLVRDVVGARLEERAAEIGHQIDRFLLERIEDARIWASTPTLIRAAREAHRRHQEAGLPGLPLAQVEQRFETRKSLGLYPEADRYLRRQIELSPHFGEMFFTDRNGFNVAFTNPTSDFVQSDEDWWQRAWADGLSVGDVKFDKSAGIWSVDIAVRIDDPGQGGEPLGVLKAVLGVSLVQEVASEAAARIRDGRVTVMGADGLLVAETTSEHARGRIMNPAVNLRESPDPGIRMAFGPQRSGFHVGESLVSGYARTAGARFYRKVAPRFQGFDWVVVVQQPSRVALAPLEPLRALHQEITLAREELVWTLGGAAVVVLLVSLLLGWLLARQITVPIEELRALAERVSLGDTSRPVEVRSDDEIGELAASFERMRRSIELAMRRLGGSGERDSAPGSAREQRPR